MWAATRVTRRVGGIRDIHALLDAHAPGTHCYLNVVLTDGVHAASCRYSSDPDYIDSLYINAGSRYVCDNGTCWMEPSEGNRRAILISSEPLNEGPRWVPVERNHLVTVDRDLTVLTRPVEIS